MSILRRHSKGQMMVLYAIALPALLGVAALGTDVAVMYVNWQAMQRAADAAALAGAGKLDGTAPSDAGAIANAKVYATNNGLAAGEVATPTVSADHKTITVSASRTVPYYFAQALGMLNASVQVTATAQIQPINGTDSNHLVPFGFVCVNPGANPPDCKNGSGVGTTPGSKFALPGNSNNDMQSPGNWSGLAFNDGQQYTGSHYKNAVINGYQGTTPIYLGTVSDVITTTGNDVNVHGGPGVAQRYNSGTAVPDPTNPSVLSTSELGDSRVIEIPMVQAFGNGKSITVYITGFITAIIVPDGKNGYAAQVVSTNETGNIPNPNGPITGSYQPVLIR